MVKKHSLLIPYVLALILLTTGCLSLSSQPQPSTPLPTLRAALAIPTETQAPVPTQTPVESTGTPAPSPTPTLGATETASPTEAPVETHIAYVQNGTLLVTHVLGGKALDTREIVKSPQGDGIMNVGWSPSGKILVFTMLPDAFPHLYIANLASSEKPVDLGIVDLTVGKNWAWSPDSKTLAFEHEYELWLFSPAGGTKKQLTTHLGTNWLWSLPVFTPDGKALWAVGTNSRDMDFHGTTTYKIYRIPLDGSGAAAYPPGRLQSITSEMKGGLPLDLRFSPDGQSLALILSETIENCAKRSFYQLGNADGKEFHDLPIPSLAASVGPKQDPYFSGDSLVWDPQSGGLWVNGVVRDCTIAAAVVAGPQISYLTRDGQEQVQIPGVFSQLSIDGSATILGVVRMTKDGPHVQLIGRDGRLVLDLGLGDHPALQP